MTRTIRRLLCALLLSCVGIAPALAAPDLLKSLRAGGLVIYLRHADTGPASPDGDDVDLRRCETQRNLSEAGRAQAADIGAQFRRLGIPVGEVMSSAFCRCWQTADLAFGRHEKMIPLTVVPRGSEHADARRSANASLHWLLATPPPAGANTVLVSHGFNLQDLTGVYLATQGEAAIYEPDGVGGYKLIRRILPDEWATLGRD